MCYNILIELIIPITINKNFLYLINSKHKDLIFIGQRVIVQLGNIPSIVGIINNIHNNITIKDKSHYKYIIDVLDDKQYPVINHKALDIWQWIATYYMCNMQKIIRSAMGDILSLKQKNLHKNISLLSNIEINKHYVNNIGELIKSPNQITIIKFLLSIKDNKLTLLSLINSNKKISFYKIKNLLKKKILFFSINNNNYVKKNVDLNNDIDKQISYDIFCKIQNKKILLFHTYNELKKHDIYISFIHNYDFFFKNQILILCSSHIRSLYIYNHLIKHFKHKILLYNSKINKKDKVYIWKMIISGDPIIIIGSKSSVLIPFGNLDLIIIDNENDFLFKSNNSPYYNARDVGIFLGKYHNASIILTSDNPSIISYFNVTIGKYGLLRYKHKTNYMRLKLLNMYNKYDNNFITNNILKKIQYNVNNRKQVILYHSNNDYINIVKCTKCNKILKCIKCNKILIYYVLYNFVQCFSCKNKIYYEIKCNICQSNYTQDKLDIYNFIKINLINNYKIDIITSNNNDKNISIIKEFNKKNINIIFCNHMIFDYDIKNYDIGLIIMLNFDKYLKRPYYNSFENINNILHKIYKKLVCNNNELLLQTFDITQKMLQIILSKDYFYYYNFEIEERKQFLYPPFCKIIYIELIHNNDIKLKNAIQYILDNLITQIDNSNQILISDNIFLKKIKNIKKYIIMVKIYFNSTKKLYLAKIIIMSNINIISNKYKGIKFQINVDPL